MSRFRIDHPTNPNLHCIAGVDHMLGFFCELHREGRDKPIKTLDMFTAGKPVTLNDIFDFMIHHDFFTVEQLQDALVYLQDGSPKPRSKGVMRVVGIVMGLKGE